jgi:hypothetical protein
VETIKERHAQQADTWAAWTFPAALVAALFPNGVNGQDRAALVTQLAGH